MFIRDSFIKLWDSFHPWFQFIISLGLFSQVVRRILLWFNELIKLKTKKDTVFKKPQEVIDKFRIVIFVEVRKFLAYILAYFLPKKEIKEEVLERTHWIKLQDFSKNYWIRELQNKNNKRIKQSVWHFDTWREALGDAKNELWNFTTIRIEKHDFSKFIFFSIHAPHLLKNENKHKSSRKTKANK